MKILLSLIVLLSVLLFVSSAPPTCYSRILSLSKEITESFKSLKNSKPVDPCVETLPNLYLDVHNYCVLAKLRNFVAYPRCQRVPQLSALKEKARSLYTIMISYCRRDLVFLTDDCYALESPILTPTDPSSTYS
ncbi:cytokine-like protein 1 [Alligator mississippiensis]|uniref:Cytokine-like protein 1 n=2 Tax=Alligator TaxID=8495 RepID=A0A151P9J0_ALLMI|nr:cytokine-like protein 1 [Alligator sinensis]XP_006267375.1 cytokine-like protein 1 [Alligator mississippiensis]KYO45746.1 cytokine-like protein 1 [Alligator mississippiensis]